MIDSLWLWVPSGVALVLSCASLWRCLVPPQRRHASELQGRIEDLEFTVEQLRERLNKRGQSAAMTNARETREERAANRRKIEEEAAALIDASKAVRAQPAELTRDELRTALNSGKIRVQ